MASNKLKMIESVLKTGQGSKYFKAEIIENAKDKDNEKNDYKEAKLTEDEEEDVEEEEEQEEEKEKKKKSKKRKIKKRIEFLPPVMPRPGRAWNSIEIRKLLGGYSKKSAKQLAKNLKRSVPSVRSKLKSMKVTKGTASKRLKQFKSGSLSKKKTAKYTAKKKTAGKKAIKSGSKIKTSKKGIIGYKKSISGRKLVGQRPLRKTYAKNRRRPSKSTGIKKGISKTR